MNLYQIITEVLTTLATENSSQFYGHYVLVSVRFQLKFPEAKPRKIATEIVH